MIIFIHLKLFSLHKVGLLWMSDLVRVQPDIKINLFIAAQNERREKIASENHRPTFAKPKPPLPQDLPLQPCSQTAAGGWSRSGGRVRYMKQEFISQIPEVAVSRIAQGCGLRPVQL